MTPPPSRPRYIVIGMYPYILLIGICTLCHSVTRGFGDPSPLLPRHDCRVKVEEEDEGVFFARSELEAHPQSKRGEPSKGAQRIVG